MRFPGKQLLLRSAAVLAALVYFTAIATARAQTTENVVYPFPSNGSEGSASWASLLMASDGNLYGTEQTGGQYGCGTVFEFEPAANTEVTLHDFDCSAGDGVQPLAGLMEASDGNLYGTTSGGGSNGAGTVFSLSKDGNGQYTEYQIVYSFQGGVSDGSRPYNGALVEGPDGNLYGTTLNGGYNGSGAKIGGAGVIFMLTKASGYTQDQVLVNGPVNGALIQGFSSGLILADDGNLYGTFQYGVYQLSVGTGGTLSVLNIVHWASAGSDGEDYTGIMQAANGSLVGVTQYTIAGYSASNSPSPHGIIWSQSKDAKTGQFDTCPPASGSTCTSSTYSTLYTFSGGSTGGTNAWSAPIQGSDGNLYGTAGLVYELEPSNGKLGAATFTPVFEFSNSVTDGASPIGGLAQDGNAIYGVTSIGGPGSANTNCCGVIYDFTLSPIATTTTYTGTTSFTQGASATFTGTLVNAANSSAISGQSVNFTIASGGSTQTCSGTTDGTGTATCTLTSLLIPTGSATVTASFAGGTGYNASLSADTDVTIAAAFSLSANPESNSVQAGQSAGYTITLTPAASFDQAVSFSCSGLPSGATCSFAPGSLTPSGAPIITKLTVATASTTATMTPAGQQLPGRRGSSPTAPLSAIALTMCGLFWRKRLSPAMRRWTRNAACLLVLAAAGFACGCSGGTASSTGSSGGSPTTTTTTITVTGTAGSGNSAITNQTQITLAITT